jgi:hypothetical protein
MIGAGRRPLSSPFAVVNTCLIARDSNRPFLLRRVFAPDAEVEVRVRAGGLAFPSATGLAAIEDALCRRFATDFENVHTFALARPAAANRRHFPCHWLQGMSAKGGGPVWVGCGREDWHFAPDVECRVERLAITVEAMQELPADELVPVMEWLTALPHPWSTPGGAIAAMPALAGLEPVARYLRAAHPLPPEW